MVNRRISTSNMEADDQGIRFDVDVDGRMVRTHISYRRLLQRPATQADRALPPKLLLESRLPTVQALVDDEIVNGWSGSSNLMID